MMDMIRRKQFLELLSKDDILKLYISHHDFRSTNVNDAGEDDIFVSYKLYVFEIRYQKNLEAAQSIKVELKVSENIPAGIKGCALV